MKKGFACVVVAAISCSLFANFGLSQSSNATLSGTVSDSAKALIPGVTISATNTDTAVVTTGITNESGTYSISGLLPGVYKVTAELPGFQTQSFTDVRLGNAAQARTRCLRAQRSDEARETGDKSEQEKSSLFHSVGQSARSIADCGDRRLL